MPQLVRVPGGIIRFNISPKRKSESIKSIILMVVRWITREDTRSWRDNNIKSQSRTKTTKFSMVVLESSNYIDSEYNINLKIDSKAYGITIYNIAVGY